MAKIDEKEFNKIIKDGQRIRTAIHNLFTGKAFFTPIKKR